MNNDLFQIEVENSCNRSKRVLIKKGSEYSGKEDRLEQFYRAGAAQNINPCEALVGMMAKHFTSVCDLAKDPTMHNLKKWREKTGDLRNYTILLEALLLDIGVE